jgi:hypothetical protein
VFATGRLLKKASKLNSPTMDCAALGARLSSVLPKLGRHRGSNPEICKATARYRRFDELSRGARGAGSAAHQGAEKFVIGSRCRPYMIA